MVEFALGTNRSAVSEHDVFGDSQSQTSATGLTGAGFIYTIETFKQASLGVRKESRDRNP